MAAYINAAIDASSKPDGFMVSIPNAAILGPAIKKSVAAGIPVVSLNSGYGSAGSLGALTHVGQTEFEAGEMAGGASCSSLRRACSSPCSSPPC